MQIVDVDRLNPQLTADIFVWRCYIQKILNEDKGFNYFLGN